MHHASKYKPKPFTDIFTPDTDINRSKCVRTVPMKVLILGLDRTGTACKATHRPACRLTHSLTNNKQLSAPP